MDPNNQNNLNYPALSAPQFQMGVSQPSSYQVLYPGPTMQPVQPMQQQMQPQMQQQFISMQPMQFQQNIDYSKQQNIPISAQPQVVYFQPPPQFSEVSQPFLREDVKTRLTSLNYHVEIGHWLSEGWHLYKEHWMMYAIFTVFYVALAFIPYVGTIFSLCLFPGLLIAGLHQIRPSTQFNGFYFLHGFYYFFPIFGISLLYALAVFFGLFLLIVPGIWLAVVLSFSTLVYVEHHDKHNGIGIWASLSISRKVASKQFCSLFLFFLVILFLNLVGAFTILGILISLPVTTLAMIVGFRHMFGLNQERRADTNCLFCC